MGLSCQRADTGQAGASGGGGGPVSAFELSFDDVQSFLEEYRGNLQRDLIWMPSPEELASGQVVNIRIKPPFFKQRLDVRATVLERRELGYQLRVDDLSPTQRATLQAYSGLCETIWDACMKQILGQLAEGRAPSRPRAEASSAPPTPAPSPAEASPASPAPTSAPASPPAASIFSSVEDEPAVEAPPTQGGIGGAMTEDEAARALSRLAFSQATGAFVINAAEGRTELFLRKGWLVRVNAPQVEERTRLGDILVRTGVIPPEVRDEALSRAGKEGCLFGQALIRSRKLASDGLQQALERQLHARLLGALKLHGTFRFSSNAPLVAAPDVPPVNPGRVFYRRAVRNYTKRTPNEVYIAERTVSGQILAPAPDAPRDLALLALERPEKDLWEQIVAAPRTLDELYVSSPLPRRQTHAVIFAWKEIGLLAQPNAQA